MRLARLNCPPIVSDASNRVTAWPRSASVVAAARPAGPAPTTAMRFGAVAGRMTISVSWQARGLTRQEASCCEKVWSRQAWLQAMQVLMLAARPAAALRTNSGSASNGRAIDTKSASPAASTASATSGVLMRLLAQTGSDTSPLSLRASQVNAARGTEVAMVGMRASCQPMPEFSIEAPAASMARASSATSDQS